MSNPIPSHAAPLRLTSTQWLICVIASIGFAFDIYELLMMPLINADALKELGNITPADSGNVRSLANTDVLRAGGLWRHFWITGRIFDRSPGTPSSLDVEHPALCVFGIRGRILDDSLDAALLPHDDVHWCLYRVCRGCRVAGGTVRQSRSARKRCSDTRRRFHRSADCWWRLPTD